MSWDAVGALSELLGAVAVVATLIYLSKQIRQNTLTNQNAALQTISSQYADWLARIIDSDDVARIYRIGLSDPEKLNDDERLRFGMLLTHLCRASDAQYHQYLSNALPAELWSSTLSSVTDVFRKPGGLVWWNKFGSTFSKPFSKEIDLELEKVKPPSNKTIESDT
ncbi:MAG: hypothetical protein ACU84Q_20490 [Gammaproteobacteria bacterium]